MKTSLSLILAFAFVCSAQADIVDFANTQTWDAGNVPPSLFNAILTSNSPSTLNNVNNTGIDWSFSTIGAVAPPATFADAGVGLGGTGTETLTSGEDTSTFAPISGGNRGLAIGFSSAADFSFGVFSNAPGNTYSIVTDGMFVINDPAAGFTATDPTTLTWSAFSSTATDAVSVTGATTFSLVRTDGFNGVGLTNRIGFSGFETPTAIPEPSPWPILGLGLACLALKRWRRK